MVTIQATARRNPNQPRETVAGEPRLFSSVSSPKPDNPMPSAMAAAVAPTPRVATEKAGETSMISLRDSQRRVSDTRLATMIATLTILSLIVSLGFASLQLGRVANRPLLISP